MTLYRMDNTNFRILLLIFFPHYNGFWGGLENSPSTSEAEINKFFSQLSL